MHFVGRSVYGVQAVLKPFSMTSTSGICWHSVILNGKQMANTALGIY